MKFFDAMAQVAAGERVCRFKGDGELRWLWVDIAGQPRDDDAGDPSQLAALDWLIDELDLKAHDWEVRAAPSSVGSFAWALDQIQHGETVRRRGHVSGGLRMDHYDKLVFLVGGAVVVAPALARMATYNDWEIVA